MPDLVKLSIALFICLTVKLGWVDEQRPVDCARDIRSILSENCFSCHGPDDETREAELRLDRRKDAIAEHYGTAAIVPEKSQDSELIRRITTADADLRMRPPDSGHELTNAQIAMIRRWDNIEEFRILVFNDRVDTTMQVWMELTMGCAKCHSHKYDLIIINEYYEFFAFFNQTEDADRRDDSPRASTRTVEQETARAELVQQLPSRWSSSPRALPRIGQPARSKS